MRGAPVTCGLSEIVAQEPLFIAAARGLVTTQAKVLAGPAIVRAPKR